MLFLISLDEGVSCVDASKYNINRAKSLSKCRASDAPKNFDSVVYICKPQNPSNCFISFRLNSSTHSADNTHTKLQVYIQQVVAVADDMNSTQFKVAINNFKNYVESQYQIEAITNKEVFFCDELFLAISLLALKNNFFHFLLFLTTIINTDIGNKFTKANRISRELTHIPPSNDKRIFIFLERALSWLSNPLGTSLQMLLQPIRDKIWTWFCSEDNDQVMSSLYLLDIFLRVFPHLLINKFDNVRNILMRTLLNESNEVRKLASNVLISAVSLLPTSFASHIRDFWIQIYNFLYQQIPTFPSIFVYTILYVIDNTPNKLATLYFKKPPIDIIQANLKEAPVYTLVALAYRCSPEVFTPNDIHTILTIFDQQLKEKMKHISQPLGRFAFMLDLKTIEANKEVTSSIVQTLLQNLTNDERYFAVLSLISPSDQCYHTFLENLFSQSRSTIVMCGLEKFCSRYRKRGPNIRARILPQLTASIISRSSDDEMINSFMELKRFNFSKEELSLSLVLKVSQYLNDSKYLVRKATADFLVTQQNNYATILQRLIAFIINEPSDELRLVILSNLDLKDKPMNIINPLFGLLHDRQMSIRCVLVSHLCEIPTVFKIVHEYIAELVQCLNNSEKLKKEFVVPLKICIQKQPSFVLPFVEKLLKRMLRSLNHSTSSLQLLPELICRSSSPIDLDQLASIITLNLNSHVTTKKIEAALDVLYASLHHTEISLQIRTKYTDILFKLLELTSHIQMPKIMEIIGYIGYLPMRRSGPKSQTHSDTYKLIQCTEDPIFSLTNFSIYQSLEEILKILNDDNLSALHSTAIEALLSILRHYKNVDPKIKDPILKKIVSNGSGLLQNILPLLTVFGDSLSPYLGSIINNLCDNWNKINFSLILKAIKWIAMMVPTPFQPYAHKVSDKLLSNLGMHPLEKANEIFTVFLTFGDSLSYVDYLLIPTILNFMVLNVTETEIISNTLSIFKDLLIPSLIKRWCTEITRNLLLISERNQELIPQIKTICRCLLDYFGDNFEIFVPFFSQLFPPGEEKSNLTPEPPRRESRMNQPASVENKNFIPDFRRVNPKWDAVEWNHWCDEFIPLFLSASPSKAITLCLGLSERNLSIRTSLFPVSFALSVSMNRNNEFIMEAIQIILTQKTVPLYIVRYFLSAVEHLEMNDIKVDISWEILAERALDAGQYAQAIRYNEYIYSAGENQTSAENLIFLNQKMGLNYAANGILLCSNTIEIRESLAIRLERWDDVLASYESKLAQNPNNKSYLSMKMRCLKNLYRFIDLDELVNDQNSDFAATTAYHLFNLEKVKSIPTELIGDDSYKCISYVLHGKLDEAEQILKKLNDEMMWNIFPISLNDYEQSFEALARSSLYSDLMDVIKIKRNLSEITYFSPEQKKRALEENSRIYQNWEDRFEQLKGNQNAMFDAICVRNLALDEESLQKYLIRFLIRVAPKGQSQLFDIALKKVNPVNAELAVCLLLRNDPERKKEATERMAVYASTSPQYYSLLGDWAIEDGDLELAATSLKNAISASKSIANVWISWAKVNYELYKKDKDEAHLIASMEANLKGLSITSGDTLNFTLRITSILFQNGSKGIYQCFSRYFEKISGNAWLPLLPQIIARLGNPDLKNVLEKLILVISRNHPNAVLYSLIVPYQTTSPEKQRIAASLISKLQHSYPLLVNQILLFSHEMIRIAASWWEIYYAAIDEASKRYIRHQDMNATFQILQPLYQGVSRKPETLHEIAFLAENGPLLATANQLIEDYKVTKNEASFHQAWTIFVDIFKTTRNKQSEMMQFNLEDASPSLAELVNTEISIPGLSFEPGNHCKIVSIDPTVDIFKTKQRPRKLALNGSDGRKYTFLLKPNEDTRLDERVMQLFRFISNANRSSNIPLGNKLTITSYRVVPLNEKAGLIGWVPDCQTVFEVVKQYRINCGRSQIDKEMAVIYRYTKDFDNAPLELKLSSFKNGCKSTPGNDIQMVLFKYSTGASDWLERRLTFTTSLAVTSMAGYILGLGDRHVCNIMLANRTGKLVHIDFGDCFEVARNRSAYPEKVPFRLTRLFVNALEISKIEGTFRSCCENVMQIIHDNGEQIMGLLEAFLYDPLLQWKANDTHDHQTAFKILVRIKSKLTGFDFDPNNGLSLHDQVDKLISEATDPMNLCQMFKGWYPWW